MSGLRFYLLVAAFCSCSLLGRGDVVPKTELIDLPVKVQGLAATNAVLPASATVSDATYVTESEPTPASHSSSISTKTTAEFSPRPTPAPTTEPTAAPTAEPTPKPPAPTPKPPAPTPPPQPHPIPAPDQGIWPYTDPNTNVTCIVAQFAAQINITYTMTVNNVTSLHTVAMNVPANASILAGSCNATATEQWMLIGWRSNDSDVNATVYNTIRLVFLKNETTKNYALNNFNLVIDVSVLENASIPVNSLEFSHGEEWATPLATSYRCLPATKLSMSNETYDATAVVTVSQLQEEAFKTSPGKGFSAARECGGGDVPDAVPIAVGCALGGLVLVVLIAYLVARRRSAARGYLSM